MLTALLLMLSLGSSDKSHHEEHHHEPPGASKSAGEHEEAAHHELREGESTQVQANAEDRADSEEQCKKGNCHKPGEKKPEAKVKAQK